MALLRRDGAARNKKFVSHDLATGVGALGAKYQTGRTVTRQSFLQLVSFELIKMRHFIDLQKLALFDIRSELIIYISKYYTIAMH